MQSSDKNKQYTIVVLYHRFSYQSPSYTHWQTTKTHFNYQTLMEKQSPERIMKSSHLCIPRLKATTIKNNHRLSPMTLLERFREAVFRLMMLSALSKATNSNDGSPVIKRSYYRPSNDSHHSEAVADCIEFIKKTAVTDEDNGGRKVSFLWFLQ